jgi:LPS sulfotransferase NodH
MKRAYLVTGPESAGNRLLAGILAGAGCHGTGSTDSVYTDTLPDGSVSPVVVIRSQPHGDIWPETDDTLDGLMQADYEVTVLVTTRAAVPLERSQVAQGHAPTEELARVAISRAYDDIFAAIIGVELDWLLVPYESLVMDPEVAIPALLERLGLDPAWSGTVEVDRTVAEISDANRKHYTEAVPA